MFKTQNINARTSVGIYKKSLYVQMVITNSLLKKMDFPTIMGIFIIINQAKSCP